jgi:hypothetical protein
MGTAKVVSMRSRPFQITHLCFDSDGILGALNTQLGAPATAFDFPTFNATLAAAPTVAGDPSRLLYDFPAIQTHVAPVALAALRAEPRKAALDKAVNARQNAYFSKYGNIAAIVARINAWYSPNTADSKPNRLAILTALATDQANALKAAYTADNRLGVVKRTYSVLESVTKSGEITGETSTATETGFTNEAGLGATLNPGNVLPSLPTGSTNAGVGFTKGNVYESGELTESVVNDQTTTRGGSGSKGLAVERQLIVNTDYGYRMPYYDSQAQNERAQISLIDQQFSQFMYSQQLPNLTTIFQNELRSIDGDVYRLQIAFLNSILLAPFAGTVTGVYKYPGDSVRAGEPVLRVENNETVLVVATVVYRDRIAVGANASIQTNLYDSATTPTTVTGTVVAARGHASDDDQWDIVVKCNNVSGGAQVLPIDYNFDYDDTVVTIT